MSENTTDTATQDASAILTKIQEELGLETIEEVVPMVRSLESQLADIYSQRESSRSDTSEVIDQIQQVNEQLEGQIKDTEVAFETEKRGGRWQAIWKI